jgi:serine protease Do
MKLRPWLLAIVVLILVRTLPEMVLRLPSESDPKSGKTEAVSVDACQTMRPAVVTLYAGSEIGSGSLISQDGLILTNYHVVREALNQPINVKTSTDAIYQGQVIGSDLQNDLALVRVSSPKRFERIISLAKTDQVAGQEICAIGSPFNQPGSISRGILTGYRENGDLKAAILLHPGNSGGPLLNLQGEMIGVAKAIWESENGENSGISFATNLEVTQKFIAANRGQISNVKPLPTAEPTTSNRQSPNVIAAAITPRLGVVLNEQTLTVQEIESNSVAARSGLKVGDRLVAINNKSLNSFAELEAFLANHPTSMVLTIEQNQQNHVIQIRF